MGGSGGTHADDKANHVEPNDPSLLRQKLLRDGDRQRARDPHALQDVSEPCTDRRTDLVSRTRAVDDGHRREVDQRGDWRLDELHREDLQEVRAGRRGATGKHALEKADEEVGEGR